MTETRSKRYGDWIQTATGVAFWPLDPRPEEVNLEDIATALSNTCRYGGQLPNGGWFSVAQHSVLVALAVPHVLRRQALLHDATEAYLVDVPRPIKKMLREYELIESRLAEVIGRRFDCELVRLSPEVKLADNRALSTEKRDLIDPFVNEPRPWAPLPPPWAQRINPWSRQESKEMFLVLAKKLGLE